MVTGELKSKIDRVWEAFWTGGISNPLTVIEQMTYLLFIRRLDELRANNHDLSINQYKEMAYQTTQHEPPAVPRQRIRALKTLLVKH